MGAWRSGSALATVGARLAATGVAVTVADSVPFVVPATARTWKLYCVPLARPVTVWLVVVALLLVMSVHDPQLTVVPVPWRSWYLSMALLDGSVQVRVTCASPAVAVRPAGASGGFSDPKIWKNGTCCTRSHCRSHGA